MDEQTKKAISKILDEVTTFTLWKIRDEHHITVNKVRATVFVDGISIEHERWITDPEQFEENYQEYLKAQVLEEAKKAHKDAP